MARPAARDRMPAARRAPAAPPARSATPGKERAADDVKLDSQKTVQGERVPIVVRDGGVKVDDANVVKTDIVTSNGVIHVIDTVLMPN